MRRMNAGYLRIVLLIFVFSISFLLYRKSPSKMYFSTPVTSNLVCAYYLFCFCVSEDVARGVFFYPSHYLRIVLLIFVFSVSFLLYRRSSSKMYFSTPVTSNLVCAYYLFCVFCFERRRPWCIFLPISLLEDRFIRISYFGIIFVVSEFVAQDVIF